MGALLGVLLVGFAIQAARSARRIVIARNTSPIDRAYAGLLPLAAAGALILLLGQVASAPVSEWNAARLAHAFALVHGYPLYSALDRGPISCNNYGPVATFWYLPATLIRSPATAVRLGSLLSASIHIGSVLVLAGFQSQRPGERRGIVLAAAALFGSMVAAHRCLAYQGLAICADAPALGLSVLACGLASRPGALEGWRGALSAATLGVLATWSKQTAVPVLVVLPVYAALVSGRRASARVLASIALVGVAASAIFVMAFGFEPLRFQLFTIPAGHDWLNAPGATSLAKLAAAVGRVLVHAAAPAVFLLVVGWWTWPREGRTIERARSWLSSNPWALVAALGVAAIPTSALGQVKWGGDENSDHTMYYVLAASVLYLAAVAGRSEDTRSRRAARVLVLALIGAHLACAPLDVTGDLWAGTGGWRGALIRSPLEVATDVERERPGEVYFPQLPLVALAEHGRAYHFEYGIVFQAQAGIRVSAAHVRAFLPPRMSFIAFTPQHPIWRDWFLTMVPEFTDRVDVAELPGFLVYARRGAGPGTKSR